MRQQSHKKPGALKREIWIFPGFLVFATFLWFLLQLFGNQKEIAIQVGLVPENMPPGFQMVDTPTVAVFLSGSGWSLQSFNSSQAPLLFVEGAFEPALGLMAIAPATISGHEFFKPVDKVRLQHHKNFTISLTPKSQKTLPITLRYHFSPAKGMDFSKPPKSQQDSVVVFGPENLLDTLTAIYTESFEIAAALGPFDIQAPLWVPHPELSLALPTSVAVQGEIDYFVAQIFEIPISLEKLSVAYQWTIFPKTAQVNCVMPLKQATALDTKNLKVFAVQPSITKQDLLALEMGPLPNFVKSARLLQSSVQFQIKKP